MAVRADRLSRALRFGAIALIGGVAAHTLDHAIRQSRGIQGLPVTVIIGGTLAAVAALETAERVLKHDPRAAIFAMVVGIAMALLVSSSHLVPDWGPISDSYVGNGFDAVSWLAVLWEVGAALWLGVAGLLVVLSVGPSTEER